VPTGYFGEETFAHFELLSFGYATILIINFEADTAVHCFFRLNILPGTESRNIPPLP
jgi:hypothetical protein